MLESGQVGGGYLGLIEFLRDYLPQKKPDLLLCEDFILRRGKAMSSEQTAPERGIGATAALASVNNIDMVLITPAENKSIPDSALKTLGLWGQPGHVNRHQRDASRLNLNYMKSRKNRPLIERLWPEDA